MVGTHGAATIKLGTLLVRTLAKPLANHIKSQAKVHPKFKEFCIGVAQKTHAWEHNLKTRFLGYPKETVRPLNDSRAVETGANFISEGVIFSVAALTVLGETWRSSRNTKQRRNDVEETLEELRTDLNGALAAATETQAAVARLTFQVETLTSENRRLGRWVGQLAGALDARLEKDAEMIRSRALWRRFMKACQTDDHLTM
ncbi:hypothetical protein HDU89_003115 [Geranomyces variabilis]|nr:hypothetical protein HDU89_003115 [Geranomyces variabilis]